MAAKNYETCYRLRLSNKCLQKSWHRFQLKELAETFSFGMYKNHEKSELGTLKETAMLYKTESQKTMLYFMGLLLLVLCSYFVLSLRAFTFFGAISAAITLVFGLITPIMMVTIHKEVEYLGDVVLSFESKGVIGSISKLLENGDVVVALVILLFSVLIPVIKVLSLAFVSVFMQS